MNDEFIGYFNQFQIINGAIKEELSIKCNFVATRLNGNEAYLDIPKSGTLVMTKNVAASLALAIENHIEKDDSDRTVKEILKRDS